MTSEVVEKLVAAWFAGEHTMFDACFDDPEAAWEAVLTILARELTDDEWALLAAGPLETLLSHHGEHFIDRVEQKAKSEPRFNRLLGGVWRCGMPDAIWERVQRARDTVW